MVHMAVPQTMAQQGAAMAPLVLAMAPPVLAMAQLEPAMARLELAMALKVLAMAQLPPAWLGMVDTGTGAGTPRIAEATRNARASLWPSS